MNLTPREREVTRLIASGRSSKQIAGDLGISFRTVVCHRFRIFQKLGVTNTAELVAQAVRMGLVDFFSGSSAPPDSDQPLSYRMTAMREENAKERQFLAALLSESRLLREQCAAGRRDLKEARRQVMGQVKELVETLNYESSAQCVAAGGAGVIGILAADEPQQLRPEGVQGTTDLQHARKMVVTG